MTSIVLKNIENCIVPEDPGWFNVVFLGSFLIVWFFFYVMCDKFIEEDYNCLEFLKFLPWII